MSSLTLLPVGGVGVATPWSMGNLVFLIAMMNMIKTGYSSGCCMDSMHLGEVHEAHLLTVC